MRLAFLSRRDATVVKAWWLRHQAERVIRLLLGRPRSTYVQDRVSEYRTLWKVAATSLGAEFTPLSTHIWEVSLCGRRTRIANDRLQLDDPVTLQIAGDKELCYRLARESRIPVPDPVVVERRDSRRALAAVRLDGTAYVTKPAQDTSAGMGVTVGVRTRRDLIRAVALAWTRSDKALIERMVAAESVRLLFLDGQMIHAVRRSGVRVHGDGASSLAALAEARGIDRPERDEMLVATLQQQRLPFGSVPGRGASVVLRSIPVEEDHAQELRTVYDEEITELVAPELVREVKPIVSAVGSELASVDLLTNDPTRPLAESGGVFLEINTTPGIHHHCSMPKTAQDPECATSTRILRHLLRAA